MDKNKLTPDEKTELIRLLLKAGEYNQVYHNFEKSLSTEQMLIILKKTSSNVIRQNIVRSVIITDEYAKQLNVESHYSVSMKWNLMENKNLSIEFREKLLTKGMINNVLKETDRSHKNRYYWRRHGESIYTLEKRMPRDIFNIIKKRYDEARVVKDIIL
jgi:hypothetical protein